MHLTMFKHAAALDISCQ